MNYLIKTYTSDSAQENSTHLVHQSNDPDGRGILIDELYRRHFKSLVQYLLGVFGSGPPEPEEIAQKAYGQLLKIDNMHTIQNTKAYLWRTARNIAVSDIRANRSLEKLNQEAKYVLFDEDSYLLTPERIIKGKNDLEDVMLVLRKMPKQRRRAFILVRIEGLSHVETARQLGISRPAVSSYVAKAATEIVIALVKDNLHFGY